MSISLAGRDAFLPWSYGLEITRQKRTIDLTDSAVNIELETFIPLIQQGGGAEMLHIE